MRKSILNRVTLVLLYVVMALGAAFMASLPWTLPVILFLPGFAAQAAPAYYAALALWLLGSGCGMAILATLTRMMQSVEQDPFVARNVARLRRMGLLALAMAGATLLAACLYFRPMLIAIAAVQLLCGLFALVLRGVFARAVQYKEENDLTI